MFNPNNKETRAISGVAEQLTVERQRRKWAENTIFS
jgi:hypothetical protein